jgi:hypothetical protein
MQPPSGATLNATYQIFFNAPYNATFTGVVAESHDFIASKVAGTSTSSGGNSPTVSGSTTTLTPTSHHNAGTTVKVFSGAGVLVGLSMLFL